MPDILVIIICFNLCGPVAQGIEQWFPKPCAHVQVMPGPYTSFETFLPEARQLSVRCPVGHVPVLWPTIQEILEGRFQKKFVIIFKNLK